MEGPVVHDRPGSHSITAAPLDRGKSDPLPYLPQPPHIGRSSHQNKIIQKAQGVGDEFIQFITSVLILVEDTQLVIF